MPETTPAPTTAAAQEQKAKWEFADGKVYEAESPEKLLELVGNRYNELWPEFQRIKSENDTLKEATTGVTETATPPDQFDQKKYFELLSTDPLGAQRYANRFDPDYQSAVSDLRQVRQMQEANSFKAMHPDFNADDAAEVDKLAKSCMALYPGSELYTAQQMAAAYRFIAWKPQETKTVNQNQNQPMPPVPPASTASVAVPDKPPEQMTQEELKAYIQRLEAAGQR